MGADFQLQFLCLLFTSSGELSSVVLTKEVTVFCCLLPLLTAVAQTQLSSDPAELRDVPEEMKTLGLAPELSCTASNVAKRNLCTVSSFSPQNLHGKGIFPLQMFH